MILLLLFTDDVTLCMKLDQGIHISSTWFYLKTECDNTLVSSFHHRPILSLAMVLKLQLHAMVILCFTRHHQIFYREMSLLVVPSIVRNLLSVGQSTRDNLCSIEFDPFGYCVKDLQTRHRILCCNSSDSHSQLSTPPQLTPTSEYCPHYGTNVLVILLRHPQHVT